MRFLFTYISFVCALFAAAQVPNYEFEVWDTFPIPTIANWNKLGNVDRTENASNGNFALTLTNKKGDASFGIIANTNLTDALAGGTKYTDMPFVMRFDVKHNLADNDTAIVLAFFKVAGIISAQVNFKVTGNSADTFVRIKYPIQWTISTPPDSVIVVVSSHTLETSVQGDGYLVFDNLVLETFGKPDDQLPNSNFENWDITPIPYPQNWYTTNRFVHDFYAMHEDVKSVVASTEAHYKTSILLQNVKVGDDVLPGIAVTGKTFSDKFPPAFSVASKWNFLNGYYKFNQQNKDTGIIAALMYRQGVLIGSGQLNISKTENTLTPFSVPITYYSSLSPDSACIVLASSNFTSAKGINTKLWVDKLSFSATTASIEQADFDLRVFPNPAHNLLFVESAMPYESLFIYDSFGRQVLTSTRDVIEIENLAAGYYVLRASFYSYFINVKFVKL